MFFSLKSLIKKFLRISKIEENLKRKKFSIDRIRDSNRLLFLVCVDKLEDCRNKLKFLIAQFRDSQRFFALQGLLKSVPWSVEWQSCGNLQSKGPGFNTSPIHLFFLSSRIGRYREKVKFCKCRGRFCTVNVGIDELLSSFTNILKRFISSFYLSMYFH